jgi:hypothetical protein
MRSLAVIVSLVLLAKPAHASDYLVNDAFVRVKAATLLVDGAIAVGGALVLRLPPPVFRSTPVTLGLSRLRRGPLV